MVERKERCETCRWWSRGECHAHPPVVLLPFVEIDYHTCRQQHTEWPVTAESDFCGEWRGKEDEE